MSNPEGFSSFHIKDFVDFLDFQKMIAGAQRADLG
jgi:hypothetical protein